MQRINLSIDQITRSVDEETLTKWNTCIAFKRKTFSFHIIAEQDDEVMIAGFAQYLLWRGKANWSLFNLAAQPRGIWLICDTTQRSFRPFYSALHQTLAFSLSPASDPVCFQILWFSCAGLGCGRCWWLGADWTDRAPLFANTLLQRCL